MSEREFQDGGAREIEPRGSLPRGRHGLPADIVEEHQRRRVAVAVGRVVAEDGYAALTVERLQRSARISRSTFYEHFANKQEAVIAAHELALERFTTALIEAGAAQPDRPSRVRAVISTALDFAATEPEEAQLVSGLPLCADPDLARRVFDSHDRLAQALCDKTADTAATPDIATRALVGAIASLLGRHLIEGQDDALAELEEGLMALAHE